MTSSAKVTVLCVAQNCAPYAEVFLRSAAVHGFREAEFCRLVLFVGKSDDGTEAVCGDLAVSMPVPTTVIYAVDLPQKDHRRVAVIQRKNEGHFNEGMWDFMIQHSGIDTSHYAGIHIDVEFLAPGLWNFLLNRLGQSAVVGIFDPGELIPESDHMILSMPRFFTLVVMANRQRAAALNLRWSRGSQARRRQRLLEDNGSTALQRAVASDMALIQEEDLQAYLKHFGYLWTKTFNSPIHRVDGIHSREAVAMRLTALRSFGQSSMRPVAAAGTKEV